MSGSSIISRAIAAHDPDLHRAAAAQRRYLTINAAACREFDEAFGPLVAELRPCGCRGRRQE